MAREFLSFDNWSLGDTGRHGPMAFHYGRRKMLASYGHFRGVNVVRYPNGAVGPRPALKKLPYDVTVNGTVEWALYSPGYDQLWLITTTGRVYILGAAYNGGSGWTTVNTGITPLSVALYQGDLYIGAAGGVYRVNTAGAQIGPFANSPANCGFLAEYREFLIGVNSTLGSTFQYSNPGDGTTWPLANQIAVSSGFYKITGLMTQRNSLVVALSNGEWWTTTGFLGADGSAGNDITRRADIGMAYTGVGGPVLQSSIWYINGRDACSFSGAVINVEPMPDPPIIGPDITFESEPGQGSPGISFAGLAGLFSPDSFLLIGAYVVNGAQTNFGFMRNGTAGWTRHTFPLTTTTLTHPIPISIPYGIVWMVAQTGTTASVYSWAQRQEYPYADHGTNPLVVELDGSSASVVNGSFSLPEWWTPDGGGVHVHGVIVDFAYDAEAVVQSVANGGTADSVCHFDVEIDALNNTKFDGPRSSGPLSWTPPLAASSRSGAAFGFNMVRRRDSFRNGDQGMGSGFQVNFTNMRGVQVYRVVVVADIDESRVF